MAEEAGPAVNAFCLRPSMERGRFHEEYDLLLTAALPIPAFEAGRRGPAVAGGAALDELDAGVPYALTSAGPDGGPAGGRHADARVLAALPRLRGRPWGRPDVRVAVGQTAAAQTVLVVRTTRSARVRTPSGPSMSASSRARSPALSRSSRPDRVRRSHAWA